MRDQVLVQKVGNRSGISKAKSGNVVQRPSRRDKESGQALRARLLTLASYIPAVLKAILVIAIGVFAFLGYRAAAAASFFQVRKIEMRGASRASTEAIQSVVRHDVGQTGVWRADLVELSAHLERLPWVRTAIVTRVLPDGIRVRITEREQKAVVRTAAGRFFWVDDDAVTLGEMAPSDQMPPFFLRGWNEDEGSSAQQENRERVQKYLELQRAWDAQGLSERVSEVNLLDLHDVRAQLSGDDSQIEIRLGSQDQATRLKKALEVLDGQRQTPRGPYISYVDMTQGKHAIVGLVSGTRAITDGLEGSGDSASEVESVPDTRTHANDKRAPDKAKDKDQKARTANRKAEQKRT